MHDQTPRPGLLCRPSPPVRFDEYSWQTHTMDKLNSKLFKEYENRFGMTFSLFSVHAKNVDKVNYLMEESLRTGKPFYDRYFAPPSKSASI